MNHKLQVIVSVLVAAYTMPLIADNKIYKCEIDGKMVYQQSRCPTKNNQRFKADSNKPTNPSDDSTLRDSEINKINEIYHDECRSYGRNCKFLFKEWVPYN